MANPFLQGNLERMRNAMALTQGAGDRRSGAMQRLAQGIGGLGKTIGGIREAEKGREFVAGEAEKQRDFQAGESQLGRTAREGEILTEYDFQREQAAIAFERNKELIGLETTAYKERETWKSTLPGEDEPQRPLLEGLYQVMNDIGSSYAADGKYENNAGVPTFLGEWTAGDLDGLKGDIKQALKAEGYTLEEMKLIQGPLNNMLQALYPGRPGPGDTVETGRGKVLPWLQEKAQQGADWARGLGEGGGEPIAEQMPQEIPDTMGADVLAFEPEGIKGFREKKAFDILRDIVNTLTGNDRQQAEQYLAELSKEGKSSAVKEILAWAKSVR